MPDDIPEFRIPLQDLTGEHKYALAPDEEGETPLEPGAPVAYVAEPAKRQPNTMTVEGAIIGIGNMASAAAKEGGTPAWTMRGVAVLFVGVMLLYAIGRIVDFI